MKKRTSIRIIRAYDAPHPDDGIRILIDRLWPRGVSKQKLKLDVWPKELTPSTELRKWYSHDPERFAEFRRRYLGELKVQGDSLSKLRAAVRGRVVTLVTATREIGFSHAEVLAEVLRKARV